MLLPTVELSGAPVAYRLPVGVTFGPRRLGSFEFVWLLSGRAVVSLDDDVHVLVPGQLQLSRPGMIDHYSWQGNRPSHAYVHFRVIDRGRLPDQERWPIVVDLPHQGALPGLLADLSDLHGSGDRSQAEEVTSLLLDRFVMARSSTGHRTTSSAPFVEEVTAALGSCWSTGRPTEPLDVGRLAAEVSLSRSQLTRLSRRHFGASPRELMELVRLSRAAMLLRRTNLNVQAIALSCGFGDQFHFAKRFRQHYHVPATQYRSGEGEPPGSPLAERSAALAELGRLAETW